MSCLSPYKVPQNFDGRFLQWTPIAYFLEDQTAPIEICPDSTDPCIYQFPDTLETYNLPIQSGDTISWIMNKSEIDSGSDVSNLRIGIVQEGVLLNANIGTITDSGSNQLFCSATIPCLSEGCNYQFVIYDESITPGLDCGTYAGTTLQNVIDDSVILGQVVTCTLNDFL